MAVRDGTTASVLPVLSTGPLCTTKTHADGPRNRRTQLPSPMHNIAQHHYGMTTAPPHAQTGRRIPCGGSCTTRDTGAHRTSVAKVDCSSSCHPLTASASKQRLPVPHQPALCAGCYDTSALPTQPVADYMVRVRDVYRTGRRPDSISVSCVCSCLCHLTLCARALEEARHYRHSDRQFPRQLAWRIGIAHNNGAAGWN